MIYGRKEIKENVILHDIDFRSGSSLIGGEYLDNSSSTIKGFLLLSSQYSSDNFAFLYSSGTQDIVNKVAMGQRYRFGAGKSGTGSNATFFIIRAFNKWEAPHIIQIGGDTSSVDLTSEIGKSF